MNVLLAPDYISKRFICSRNRFATLPNRLGLQKYLTLLKKPNGSADEHVLQRISELSVLSPSRTRRNSLERNSDL